MQSILVNVDILTLSHQLWAILPETIPSAYMTTYIFHQECLDSQIAIDDKNRLMKTR